MTDQTTLPEATPADDAPVVAQSEEADATKIDRIVGETKTLSEDVVEWIRLKIQLLQIEIHERITQELNAILSSVIVLGLFMIAILLLMTAVGFYLGDLVGSTAYGFGIAAAFIMIIAVVMGRAQPQWIGNLIWTLVPRQWLRTSKEKNDKTPKS